MTKPKHVQKTYTLQEILTYPLPAGTFDPSFSYYLAGITSFPEGQQGDPKQKRYSPSPRVSPCQLQCRHRSLIAFPWKALGQLDR